MAGSTCPEKALLILNPAAGRHGKKQVFWDTAESLIAAGYEVAVCLTQKMGDAAQFATQLGGGYDLIVSGGGDGTLSEVVGGMVAAHLQTRLCHLPLGTTNDLARILHLPKKPRDIVAMCDGHHFTPIDAGFLNDHLFTYVAAFGAFTDVTYLTTQPMKNKYGYSAYVMNAASALKALRPYEALITTDKGAYEGRFIYGSMSNATSIGGGVLHLKNAQVSLSDGRLELLLIRYPETIRDWLRTLTNLTANRFDGHHLILEKTKTAQFIFNEPVAWTVDGENAGAYRHVNTQVKPAAYRIVGATG